MKKKKKKEQIDFNNLCDISLSAQGGYIGFHFVEIEREYGI